MIIKTLRYMIDFVRGSAYGLVRNNPSRIALQLRSRLHKSPCRIDTGVTISNPALFKAGQRSALYHGTYILNDAGTMTLGNDSHLGALCFVNVCHGALSIGDDVAIGPHTSIIVYSNHYRAGKKVTEERIQKDIYIGNNVFIGAHCTILPGARIEDNVVVGAGSVVKGTLVGPAVYAGTPCKKIRDGWDA